MSLITKLVTLLSLAIPPNAGNGIVFSATQIKLIFALKLEQLREKD